MNSKQGRKAVEHVVRAYAEERSSAEQKSRIRPEEVALALLNPARRPKKIKRVSFPYTPNRFNR